ncbi:MAG TPA: FAD-dependent oxidoreductase [Candidatus Pacearchaeota archaeon]|nr:FAD-dependent oxidoreductase [Candidatus Pacearchaeota archaeon]HOS12559.1 FAD-dependent oxidoreductase [Candidatus Pacearchaeota archaeon]HPL72869.1 FAD-dependent oxidoreductase [Candidatus Pacearchaeota archaeon]
MMYDLVIVGAGPAGMTSAIYSARQKLKTLIISKDFGGQMAQKAVEIENYPGFEKITGFDLISKMENQIKNVDVVREKVIEVKKENDIFFLKTEGDKVFQSKVVIIATGAEPRRLNVLGEVNYLGRGVSYCSTCDGPLFKNKEVAIIGGGDAGFETAIFMKNYASKIYILEQEESVKASIDNQKKASGIEVITSARLKEIKGDNFVNQIVFELSGKEKTLDVKGVFIQAGYIPETSFLGDLVELNEKKEIIVNFETFETKTRGLFAVGDVNCGKVKQIVVACGQGATAVIHGYKYI